MLENAGALRNGDERLVRMNFAAMHHNQFARFNRTDEFCANNIERNGFRCKDYCIAKLTHDQRTDAQRIAACDHALCGQADKRIGTFNTLQRINQAIQQRAVTRRRHQMNDDFGVR